MRRVVTSPDQEVWFNLVHNVVEHVFYGLLWGVAHVFTPLPRSKLALSGHATLRPAAAGQWTVTDGFGAKGIVKIEVKVSDVDHRDCLAILARNGRVEVVDVVVAKGFFRFAAQNVGDFSFEVNLLNFGP